MGEALKCPFLEAQTILGVVLFLSPAWGSLGLENNFDF